MTATANHTGTAGKSWGQRLRAWLFGNASPGRRPCLEQLEDRRVLNAGHAFSSVAPNSAAFLFTPVAEGAPLAQHDHVRLTVLVNGRPHVIPANVGVTVAGELPLHTHDRSGTIHIESPQAHTFRLRD